MTLKCGNDMFQANLVPGDVSDVRCHQHAYGRTGQQRAGVAGTRQCQHTGPEHLLQQQHGQDAPQPQHHAHRTDLW